MFGLILVLLLLCAVHRTTGDNLRSLRSTKPLRKPARAHYFTKQYVDHVNSTGHTGPYAGRQWDQRFYVEPDHFRGPGSPILLILGAQHNIDYQDGLIFPFVTDHLAPSFSALVIEVEHRFFGQSQPISYSEITHARELHHPDPRLDLLTVDQALHDAMRLARAIRDDVGCSVDRFSRHYCPLIAVGGGYGGFLAAMARLRFPSVVDMAYASSTPLELYAQRTGSMALHTHMSEVIHSMFNECPMHVKHAMETMVEDIATAASVESAAAQLGVCNHTLPAYINTTTILAEELTMMASTAFIFATKIFYPPSNHELLLAKACRIFADNSTTPSAKVRDFLVETHAWYGSNDSHCYNVTAWLPSGQSPTITAADWTGIGWGINGETREFLACHQLVQSVGIGTHSMFPERTFTDWWLKLHCQQRFGIEPQPTALVDAWHFDDLAQAGADHILFTVGEHDPFAVGALTQNLSSTLIVLRMGNVSHHSDLSYYPELPHDHATDDLKVGRHQIQTVLAEWLAEIP